ncbi:MULTISPECIES: SufD family Fe-S cluster assembly protein [unclassified Sphingomonas]|uniref:SufD family Fe-S cluster assembly protein n=1 Tax=unclassified Sphingomonas TaxID=196159 RepID=UPI002151D7EB|nr:MULTISPECIES: SufD family Fe-S cluster assembly protein [unclassified Sphingomonas]MCR5869954.1 SufD family Fe-S cluster assembly protein [Sphingomonas sp. J344]UUX98350.1 SufD family Fe-S cluster assembly protein [Sphingomonas sp. J315]
MTHGLVLDAPIAEDWRWFDAAPLDALAATPRGAAPDVAHLWIDRPGPRLLFVDGAFVAEASAPGPVEISAAPIRTPANPYSEAACTYAQAGYVLYLKSGAALDGPVQVIHVTTGGVAHLSNKIVLQADAVASLVETHVGPGWSNANLWVELGEGARLMRAVRVLKEDGAHTDYADATIGKAGSFVSTALVTGCRTARVEARLTLTGEGAYGEAGGALLTRGGEKADAATVADHAAPEGTSRQIWRAVAADTSTASIASRAQVRRDAQKTDGEQSLRGLLLKRTATVNLKPELEIFADDVKCAHGATVGELDAKALFYMQSRGIPEAQAKALLTRAFVTDAIDRIDDEAVRAAFAADADAWLEAAL